MFHPSVEKKFTANGPGIQVPETKQAAANPSANPTEPRRLSIERLPGPAGSGVGILHQGSRTPLCPSEALDDGEPVTDRERRAACSSDALYQSMIEDPLSLEMLDTFVLASRREPGGMDQLAEPGPAESAHPTGQAGCPAATTRPTFMASIQNKLHLCKLVELLFNGEARQLSATGRLAHGLLWSNRQYLTMYAESARLVSGLRSENLAPMFYVKHKLNQARADLAAKKKELEQQEKGIPADVQARMRAPGAPGSDLHNYFAHVKALPGYDSRMKAEEQVTGWEREATEVLGVPLTAPERALVVAGGRCADLLELEKQFGGWLGKLNRHESVDPDEIDRGLLDAFQDKCGYRGYIEKDDWLCNPKALTRDLRSFQEHVSRAIRERMNLDPQAHRPDIHLPGLQRATDRLQELQRLQAGTGPAGTQKVREREPEEEVTIRLSASEHAGRPA